MSNPENVQELVEAEEYVPYARDQGTPKLRITAEQRERLMEFLHELGREIGEDAQHGPASVGAMIVFSDYYCRPVTIHLVPDEFGFHHSTHTPDG